MTFGPHPKPPPRERKGRKPLRSRSRRVEQLYAGGDDCETCKGEGVVYALLPMPRKVACTACSGTGQNLGRARLVAKLLADAPICQLGDTLQTYTLTDPRHRAFRCQRFATTVHELHSRGRGGDIMDPANCRTACVACHDFVHEHPAIAEGLGLLRSTPPTR